MRHSESAAVARFAAGLHGPELGDLLQVRRPVLNLRVEDRPQHRVLPDIGVKRPDELQNSFVPAQPLVERATFIHHNKLFAFASASSSLLASLPPPRALSGLPPPLPPTIGAICWISFPA